MNENATVNIPGTNFHYPQKNIDNLKDQLQSGAWITLTPSGFGIGYQMVVAVEAAAKRHGMKLAPIGWREFWKVPTLYYRTFDCD